MPAGLIAAFGVMSMLALAISIVALVVAADGDGAGQAAEPTGPVQTVAVELGDLYVRPERVEVPSGTHLMVEVINRGDQEHDLSLNGETGTDRLQPGETQTADFGVIDSGTEAWCTVPGHREAGMLQTIAVTATPAPSP